MTPAGDQNGAQEAAEDDNENVQSTAEKIDMSDMASSSLADYEEMVRLVKDIDGNPLEISSKKLGLPGKSLGGIPMLNFSGGHPGLGAPGGLSNGPTIGLDLSKIGKDGAPKGIGKLAIPEK